MKVDFHVHSTASDGTCAPAELVAQAHGFAALALTDHDNADGMPDFAAACAAKGLRGIAGIELSIEPGKGFDRFHLLGLGLDVTHPALKGFLSHILEGRKARNVRIIENFRRLGLPMGDEIFGYAHGNVLARPHFANWLVDHGYAPDKTTAFATYLAPDSPSATRCFEERWHPSQEEAFAAIHAAGGLCVMAHPKYWCDAWKVSGPDYDAAARELARLREVGLDGVETLYQANTEAENVAFTRIALNLGFLTSAGSDFHGLNKKHIPLGMEVDEAFIAPLLERLSHGM